MSRTIYLQLLYFFYELKYISCNLWAISFILSYKIVNSPQFEFTFKSTCHVMYMTYNIYDIYVMIPRYLHMWAWLIMDYVVKEVSLTPKS